ncbi:exo-beta-N-acetylmuramidase NamZ family protein [Fuerstiella marisgermanici]|uniref:DUF1343 domain-containing protein n=1 Tax=Fuerstiella marisgermanici TaxID=1891926 RepID=A0A1P8WDD9_9PLAN|nr:DUF1343 domain-containing protein [Fuerstiella marisgermanici]APZ92051.1 hypothetical protein Fuma_01655 [Fuerstiella marisgermanici]
MTEYVKTGLEEFLAAPPADLRNANLGLLMNQASVDNTFRYACDLLENAFPGRLKLLFSPQHGLWGEQQANMIESPDNTYESLNLPVASLYSETRRPTQQMLAQIDCLVIDLQDVGTRVYTFIWTMLECLHACAKHGVKVCVLDRPNPLGGLVAEGPLLEPGFRSFVGGTEIPMRHGLTIGELAKMFNTEENIGADLTVVPMTGWRRSMLFPETRLPWIAPSPNMPRFETAVLYPGQVLLEGTTLSEGRGTTMPFEVVGAPFLDPTELLRLVNRWDHPGVGLMPVHFRPTFDKWKDASCGGLAIHVQDAAAVRSFELTVAIIAAAAELASDQDLWLPPPYEYEYHKPPIDILYGHDRYRTAANKGLTQNEHSMLSLAACDEDAWWSRCEPFLMYGAD